MDGGAGISRSARLSEVEPETWKCGRPGRCNGSVAEPLAALPAKPQAMERIAIVRRHVTIGEIRPHLSDMECPSCHLDPLPPSSFCSGSERSAGSVTATSSPKFRSGETPPFVIDLTSEVVTEVQKNHPADALWIIYRNGESIGTAKTYLAYQKEDDSFELETRVVNLRLLEKIVFMPDSKLVLTEMTTTYHLNRAGELLGIAMSGKMAAGKFVEGRPDKTDSIEGEATFHATVVGDQMHWTGRVSFRDFGTVEPQLDPSPAPKGVFLNPMHPISPL